LAAASPAPQLLPAPDTPVPSGPRFDVAAQAATIRAFLSQLVTDTAHNIVVHPEVSGQVSLQLKQVTVAEVMDILRRVYGYEYEREGKTYIVLPARLQSRVFNVDYLDVARRGQSHTRFNAGQVSASRNRAEGDGAARRTGADNDRNSGSYVATGTHNNFWQRLQAGVRAIIGQGEQRSVLVDAAAGVVVVRAMPQELRDVAAYLQTAQTNLQRQVILEAKILEVRLADNRQTGINWSALLLANDAGEQVGIGQSALRSGSAVNFPDLLDPSSLLDSGAAGNLNFGGLFALGARTDKFRGLIRLLDTQGDVQVLSSPRVATLNNQKAVIKVGSDEFFVTDIESDTDVGGTAASRSLDVELTPFFSGIALDVTPRIGQDNSVTLHVHPSVSEVRDQVKNLTVAGEQQSLPLAVSSVREADSIVRARHGQVIVIGGLMTREQQRDRGQAGWLGDIPLLGALFRQRADQQTRSELVILLRPLIVSSTNDWSQAIDAVRQRLRPKQPSPPTPAPQQNTTGSAAHEAD